MRSAKAVISENLARLGSPTLKMSYNTMTSERGPSHTLTSLKRWSVATRDLPGERAGRTSEGCGVFLVIMELTCISRLAVSQIKAIHVYDFDNTRENQLASSLHTRAQILLTRLCSVPEPPSQPTIMERRNDRVPAGMGELHKRRVVA